MKTKNKFSRSDIVIIVTVIGLSALLVTLFAMLINYAITSDFYEVDISPHTSNWESGMKTDTSSGSKEQSSEHPQFSSFYDNGDIIKVATCNRDFTIESENHQKYRFNFLDTVNIVDFILQEDAYIVLTENNDIVHIPYSYVE